MISLAGLICHQYCGSFPEAILNAQSRLAVGSQPASRKILSKLESFD